MDKLTNRATTPDPNTIPRSPGFQSLVNVSVKGSKIGTITRRIAAESGA